MTRRTGTAEIGTSLFPGATQDRSASCTERQERVLIIAQFYSLTVPLAENGGHLLIEMNNDKLLRFVSGDIHLGVGGLMRFL